MLNLFLHLYRPEALTDFIWFTIFLGLEVCVLLVLIDRGGNLLSKFCDFGLDITSVFNLLIEETQYLPIFVVGLVAVPLLVIPSTLLMSPARYSFTVELVALALPVVWMLALVRKLDD